MVGRCSVRVGHGTFFIYLASTFWFFFFLDASAEPDWPWPADEIEEVLHLRLAESGALLFYMTRRNPLVALLAGSLRVSPPLHSIQLSVDVIAPTKILGCLRP